MAQAIGYKIKDGIGIVLLEHPPINTLPRAHRARLLFALEHAIKDPAVEVIALMGTGRGFSAGEDIAECAHPARRPTALEICEYIENSPKPVLAVLHGMAIGAGLELAMAAHYRLARRDAQIGLPAVKLGLMPSAGGTQRLARLVGPETALDLMLAGSMRRAGDKTLSGLIDAVYETDTMKAGLSYARALREQGFGPRRTRERKDALGRFDEATQELLETRRTQVSDRQEQAPLEIVKAVEAAFLMPFDAAVEVEQAAYETCRLSPESIALRHAFFAERRTVQSAQVADPAPTFEKIAVLGAGALAGQIVVSLLDAGFVVHWGMQDLGHLTEARNRVRQFYDQVIAAGRLDGKTRDLRMGRLTLGASAHMTVGVDLVLQAARGQNGVPVAAGVPRLVAFPERISQVGLRFAAPVASGRLIEVIEGPDAQDAQLDAAFTLVAKLNRLPVHVVSSGMAVSERLMAACHRAADSLVDIGFSPYEVDAAMLSWGWTLPPFQLRDQLGLEATVGFARAEGAENWSARMVDLGRRGRGQGGGFYDHTPGAAAKPTRLVLETINAVRTPKRPLSKKMTAELMIAALANEGARMLSDGWATYPSDIDITSIYAFEFPRWRGGPMNAADAMGLGACIRLLDGFDHVDHAFWTPHPLLEDLIVHDRNFASLNS